MIYAFTHVQIRWIYGIFSRWKKSIYCSNHLIAFNETDIAHTKSIAFTRHIYDFIRCKKQWKMTIFYRVAFQANINFIHREIEHWNLYLNIFRVYNTHYTIHSIYIHTNFEYVLLLEIFLNWKISHKSKVFLAKPQHEEMNPFAFATQTHIETQIHKYFCSFFSYMY